MQRDMPDTSDNPFVNHHRHVAREAEKKSIVEGITARDQRILNMEKARKPKAAEKPYVPAGPWWGPKNG